MSIKNIASIFTCLIILTACQTQTITYKSITKDVRLATTYEDNKKSKIIGKKIEMHAPSNGMWYEAEKSTNGTFKFTAKGQGEKEAAEEAAEGGGGGGGGC